MRLPGTINYKDKPLPCELLELSGCVYSIDELKKYTDIANSDLKAYPLYDYIMELNSDALDKKIQSIHIPDNANSILIAEEYNAICNEYGYPIPNTDKNGLIFEDINSEFENDNETIVYENSTDNVIDMSNIENFTMSNTTKVINRDLIYSGRQCTNEWIYFSAADFPKMIDYNEVKTAHYVTARDLTEILINRRDFRDSGRNTHLFYIGVNIAFSLVGKEEHVIYNEVRDTLININNRLHNPLSDNEIICICNSIKRQYISFYCSTDISITKKGFTICPEEMLLSSDTLCRILNITDKDCTYTRHLMTASEAKRRKKQRNRKTYRKILVTQNKLRKTIRIYMRRVNCARLILNGTGYTYRKLRRYLHTSISTIKRDIKYIYDNIGKFNRYIIRQHIYRQESSTPMKPYMCMSEVHNIPNASEQIAFSP